MFERVETELLVVPSTRRRLLSRCVTQHWHAQVTFCFSILVVLFAAIVFYSEENVEVPHHEVSLNLPPPPLVVSSAGLLLAGSLLKPCAAAGTAS